MAESENATTGPQRRYYCHECQVEIQPQIPEIVCPRCEGGFVEELPSLTRPFRPMRTDPDRDIDETTRPQPNFASLFPGFGLPGHGHTHGGHGQAVHAHSPQPGVFVFNMSRNPAGRPGGFQLVLNQGSAPAGGGSETAGQPARPPQGIEGLLSMLLGGGGGGLGLPGMHGNPGDYVWGAGGLDAIITQLLNNVEGAGPPPATKERIDTLPTVKINENQVEENVQCFVCFDDFKLDEEVIMLPCKHHYHKDCIVPWLERHGTCPVCRKDLNGGDTTTTEFDANIGETIGSLGTEGEGTNQQENPASMQAHNVSNAQDNTDNPSSSSGNQSGSQTNTNNNRSSNEMIDDDLE